MSGVRRSSGVQGLIVLVQSEKHPVYLNSRVEEFLKSMQVCNSSIWMPLVALLIG